MLDRLCQVLFQTHTIKPRMLAGHAYIYSLCNQTSVRPIGVSFAPASTTHKSCYCPCLPLSEPCFLPWHAKPQQHIFPPHNLPAAMYELLPLLTLPELLKQSSNPFAVCLHLACTSYKRQQQQEQLWCYCHRRHCSCRCPCRASQTQG
jgi:hypothetical protein